MDGLFESFARLDGRISSVGQTAAKIGDHLQVKLIPTRVTNYLVIYQKLTRASFVRVQMLSGKLLARQ